MKNITPKTLNLTAETPLIVSTATNATAALSTEAPALKVQLLQISRAVIEVGASEHVAPAVHAVRELKRLKNSVEAARKQVKDPVLRLGQRIDELAKNYTIEIDAEILRIEGGRGVDGRPVKGLLGAWNEKENDRIAAEQRAIDEQAAAAQKVLDDALKAQEKLAAKSNATAKQEVAADARVQEAIANATKAASVVVAPPATAAGMKAKMETFHEITDAAALYAVRPEWFELVPKKVVMKAAISKTTILPGLRVWEAMDTKIRA